MSVYLSVFDHDRHEKTEVQTYNLPVVIRTPSTSAVHWHKTALLLSVVSMKRITDYIEKEQIHALLEYTRTCNPRDYLMLWL